MLRLSGVLKCSVIVECQKRGSCTAVFKIWRQPHWVGLPAALCWGCERSFNFKVSNGL